MQKLTKIAVAVVEHNDRFLVGMRANTDSLAGFHEFPGGKIENGESVAEAAVRECLEESGMRVQPVGLYLSTIHHYDHVSVELNFVACVVDDACSSGDPQHGFEWIDRERLKQCRFPDGNMSVLLALAQNKAPLPLNC